MATRKKARTKSKAKLKVKRGKAASKKRAAPAKSARVTAKKTVKAARKPARKAAVRRASPRKAKSAARPATAPRPAPAPAPAAPVATEATAAAPAQPALESSVPGERIGVVTHYFSQQSVAVIKLGMGSLRVGDTICVKGHTTDFTQKVESMEVNHVSVEEVGPNDDFGIKVVAHAREHDVVYKI